jgi:hypothetical protein
MEHSNEVAEKNGKLFAPTSRRNFLRYTGAGIITTGLVLTGCDDDVDPVPTTSLGAPTNLMVKSTANGSVTLTWTDNSNDEEGFRILRSTQAGAGFTEIGEVGADVTTFTVPSTVQTTMGTDYYYRVVAFRGDDDSDPADNNTAVKGGTVNLGSGDLGILNYAYALEQLEAAFYVKVMDESAFDNMSTPQKRIFTDLMKHEVAHKDFFKAAITSVAPNDIIPGLTPDFSNIQFDNLENVLATAKTFENLGVGAYNGAGKLLQTPEYLVLAGKIVSVEARHASILNYLVAPSSTDFGMNPLAEGDENMNGLDAALMPMEVLQQAQPFISNPISGSDLPSDN